MTSRDQVQRRADVRADAAARVPVTPEPGPSLPERLLDARERKGVDLYRAERDTKIRARYLAALERGDYKELPGAVYTKGFLRNYALYLGLDPDDILLQWRRERGEGPASEPVIVPPRPIAAPRQGLTFSPGILVGALLTLVVLAFAGYLGVQLLRYNKPPPIRVTDPAVAVSEVDENTTSYTLRGTTLPGATVVIDTGSGRDPIRVSAGATGMWSADIELHRGRNQIKVSATDPDTGRDADQPAQIYITVPFLKVQAPTLTVDQPADGATFANGAIPVQGETTNATGVVVSATYLGPAGVVAKPTPAPPASPAPQTVTVNDDGTFSAPFELTGGRWSITVTASSAEGKATTITRTVNVTYQGVNLVVTVKGGRAWLKVWVDGEVDPSTGVAGKVYNDGQVLTYTGKTSVEVRTGTSGNTFYTLNGRPLGSLGRIGIPETWLFAPPNAPTMTQHR